MACSTEAARNVKDDESRAAARKLLFTTDGDDVPHTDKPHTDYQSVLTKALTASQQEIPQYHLAVDCSLDNLDSLRRQLNEACSEKESRLSVNDFIFKAAALACKQIPELNSSFRKDFVREYKEVHIKFLVHTEEAPRIPTLTYADKKDVWTISKELKELITIARDDWTKLPTDVPTGTFVISSLAKYNVKTFVSMVSSRLPNAATLSIGGPFKQVVASQGGFVEASFFNVSLICDQRIVQGAKAALWLQHFKAYIEDPSTLIS